MICLDFLQVHLLLNGNYDFCFLFALFSEVCKSFLPVIVKNIQVHLAYTIIILNIGTDRSEQTVQTQIRLLLMEQSDQGLLCLLFCLHLLNTILHCKIQLFQL